MRSLDVLRQRQTARRLYHHQTLGAGQSLTPLV
jgi:hypothetical protein